MYWKMVRIAVVIFALCCGYKAVPVERASSGDTISSTIRYVALGDSIAYGYGLENREEQSYVGLVRKYLEKKYDSVILSNFGTNGMRSEDLLNILNNPENDLYGKYHATIRYADIITISIGSNDLLHLIQFDANMESVIENGGEMFQSACRDFHKNFPRIINEIKEINPDVQIYVNNIYNPAKGIGAFAGVYETADYYISLLNQCFSESDGYQTVDVKTCFDREEKSMVNLSWQGKEMDPHPSVEGHRKIANLVIKEIERGNKNEGGRRDF